MLSDYLSNNRRIKKYVMSNGKTIFKVINLPKDIKRYIPDIYANVPLKEEEIDYVFDFLREELPDSLLVNQYLLILADMKAMELDVVSFCSICVYKKIFQMGLHPENCTQSQIAEAVVMKYSDFVENGFTHDH